MILLKTMTIKQLLLACQQQVLNWNWDKTIYISSDDEGNEFHELIFLFTYTEDEVKETIACSNTPIEDIERYHKLKDIILLG